MFFNIGGKIGIKFIFYFKTIININNIDIFLKIILNLNME